jgi:hypothetical protein
LYREDYLDRIGGIGIVLQDSVEESFRQGRSPERIARRFCRKKKAEIASRSFPGDRGRGAMDAPDGTAEPGRLVGHGLEVLRDALESLDHRRKVLHPAGVTEIQENQLEAGSTRGVAVSPDRYHLPKTRSRAGGISGGQPNPVFQQPARLYLSADR